MTVTHPGMKNARIFQLTSHDDRNQNFNIHSPLLQFQLQRQQLFIRHQTGIGHELLIFQLLHKTRATMKSNVITNLETKDQCRQSVEENRVRQIEEKLSNLYAVLSMFTNFKNKNSTLLISIANLHKALFWLSKDCFEWTNDWMRVWVWER